MTWQAVTVIGILSLVVVALTHELLAHVRGQRRQFDGMVRVVLARNNAELTAMEASRDRAEQHRQRDMRDLELQRTEMDPRHAAHLERLMTDVPDANPQLVGLDGN